MLTDVLPYLACPVCSSSLAEDAGALRCEHGHAFDIARQGYVNLLSGGSNAGTADTPAMVAAREEFLGAGHLAPLVDALVGRTAQMLAVAGPGCIVDVGAGTGAYLAPVLDTAPDRVGVALDVSKHAARRAARAHDRMGAVVCDAWGALPVRTSSAALVLSVFAPRNAAEFARVLTHEGMLLVVTPTSRHVREVVRELDLITVDENKNARLERALEPYFELIADTTVEAPLSLGHADVAAFAGMGPSARHIAADELASRIEALPEPAETILSVRLSSWRPTTTV